MTAEIISVGTELLLGNILNTNAQYLSRELAALGITVRRQSTIGDNQDRLADFVNEAKQRCDLLVFTGGLGPTADDLTKETVAACFGDTLTFDPEEWQKIVDFFTRTGRETTPNNRKQAMVPVHGHKVVNHHGTAPGAWFEQDGRCAVLMPGVPHEMKAMWEESVRPLLLARQSCALHSLTLRVLGGESNLEYLQISQELDDLLRPVFRFTDKGEARAVTIPDLAFNIVDKVLHATFTLAFRDSIEEPEAPPLMAELESNIRTNRKE